MDISQKGNSLIYVILGVLILVGVIFFISGGVTYFILHMGNSQPMPQVTTTPIPIADPTANWKTYTNAVYGFSFQYPSDWGVIYDKNNIIEVSDNNTESLEIGIKKSTDKIKITRSDIVVENTEKRGTVQFLGQPLEKDMFILNGKDISVSYNNGEEISRGNITFTISLINGAASPAILNSGPPNGVSTSAELLTDQILSTFTFTTPTPTLATQQSCNSSSDCPSGSTCQTIGPIVDIPKRECVPQGQMVPFTGKN